MITVTDLLLKLDDRLAKAIYDKYKSNVAASRNTSVNRDKELVGYDEGYLCGLEAAAAIFEEILYEWNEKQSAMTCYPYIEETDL